MRITASELHGLGRGDILVLPGDVPVAAGEAFLRARHGILAVCRLEKLKVTIESRVEGLMADDEYGDSLDKLDPEDAEEEPDGDGTDESTADSNESTAETEESMGETDEEPGRAEQGELDTSGLEVRLDFDIGHLTLSLGDLQQLCPGYVLTLDTPTGMPVRIRNGTQVIGRGELVKIDERLGVMIKELSGPGDVGSS